MEEPLFLQRALKKFKVPTDHVSLVLEAGCGSTSHISFNFERKLDGIDIDREQLEDNIGLDKKILGDLQSFVLESQKYDLVVCVDVIEHLQSPEKALHNMANSLKIGGMLLLAATDVISYKGILAKFTPMKLRPLIFFLLAGKSYKTMLVDGVNKTFFPTYLRPICNINKLKLWAKEESLEVVYEKTYGTPIRKFSKPIQVFLIPFIFFCIYIKENYL